MPRYEWTGADDFQDSRNDRVVAPGAVVELTEYVGEPQKEMRRVAESDDEPATDEPSDGGIKAGDGDTPDKGVTTDDLDPHPSDLTVPEVEERVADVEDAALLETILAVETAGKNRTGAKDAIETRIAELEE
jgi:hypothetical protein